MQPGDGWQAFAEAGVAVVVRDAVERDIAKLAERAPDLADSAEAALALSLAGRIDAERSSATSVSMCAGKLLDTMAALRAMAPAEEAGDALDELTKRRERKAKAS